MNAVRLSIPDVILLEPKIFGDERGFFFESFNQKQFGEIIGSPINFAQDNQSHSNRGVLRGLHYQIKYPQGKLVRVLSGAIFDVAVDIRKDSQTFGKWVGVRLTAESHNQLWIPPGFAHGFYVLSDHADVLYKTSEYYAPKYERCIRWDDPTIGIQWPIDTKPYLSPKDEKGVWFEDAEVFK